MYKIYQKNISWKKNPAAGRISGFTLVELLVVVLIIGILASIAWAGYQKAVWKSRAAELLSRAQAMQKAQNMYFMANGVYAKKFADLDIKLPVKARTSTTNCNLSATDTTFYGDIQSSLVSPDVGGSSLVFNLFLEGPYACAGYVYIPADVFYNGVTPDRVYCVERDAAPFPGESGDFCKKVLGARKVGSIWRWSFYQLP